MKERGFTLVEMLVALAIFAGIASIGVGLLRASVDTQGAVQDRLGAMGAVNRLRSIMASDLAQTAMRTTRGTDGTVLPAFRGDADGFELVQRGRYDDGAGRQGAVQRVRWALTDGEWRRATAAMPDGSALGDGDALARDVTGAVLRYRAARGTWQNSWSSNAELTLPVAVELSLTRRAREPLVMRFQTGPTLLPPALPPGTQP